MVCSSFVTAMWRAGGLFDGYTIQATEFTPSNVYQMVFIDPAPILPNNCLVVDPINPYCQIMGTYRMTFPGISTINPYSGMNQDCESEPPQYSRIPANC